VEIGKLLHTAQKTVCKCGCDTIYTEEVRKISLEYLATMKLFDDPISYIILRLEKFPTQGTAPERLCFKDRIRPEYRARLLDRLSSTKENIGVINRLCPISSQREGMK
jgi:hypothetical protein